MLGAIIGDVIGSPYEVGSDKTKDFSLFVPQCHPTDDTICTIAVGCACVEADRSNEQKFKAVLAQRLKEIGLQYPAAGYGPRFYQWMALDEQAPYGSKANGSAMRVSPVAWAEDSLDAVERLARWSAEVTHDHPEGVRGAQAVAAAIYMARTGASKAEIRSYIERKYYDLNFTLDEIRSAYSFDMSCENSVPQAILCFLEAEDFEDAIRNAISLGGDGDTQACIAGAIAEPFFGIPERLQDAVFDFLDENLQELYLGYAEQLYQNV